MKFINDISEQHAEVTGLDVRRVNESAEMQSVSRLAGELWRSHYMPIIGPAQVEYMLDRFQSPSAIAGQIAAGYQYFMLYHDSRPIGYFAWLADSAASSLHIGKLYIAQSRQRTGLGSRVIAFTERYCRTQDLRQIWLTVNRRNHSAMTFYLRNGFVNGGCLLQDIGAGFVMDDYRMVKELPPA